MLKGRWREPDSETIAQNGFHLLFNGLTLEEVVYGNLTGDHEDEAVVVLRYDTGGTQYHHFVYIYSPDVKGPRLLAWFRAGDRSANGLYQVSVREGKVVIALYDPEKQQGDCCSSGFIRQRYRWNGSGFAEEGVAERGPSRNPSRRQVSTFGLPYDHEP